MRSQSIYMQKQHIKSKRKNNYIQGIYRAVNPSKYKGNPTNIVYRSGWELKACQFFDKNPNILQWSSEELVINYMSPLDGRSHRYFVDFWIRVKGKDNVYKEYLVEIKPRREIEPPKQTRNKKRYITEASTYAVNNAKWEAAREYCARKGWEFKILDEYDLGIKHK